MTLIANYSLLRQGYQTFWFSFGYLQTMPDKGAAKGPQHRNTNYFSVYTISIVVL
jgi:hypothetical protein